MIERATLVSFAPAEETEKLRARFSSIYTTNFKDLLKILFNVLFT